MSEDEVKILCKVTKRATKERAAIRDVVESYRKRVGHDGLDDSEFDEAGYFVTRLGFFGSDLNTIPELLREIAPHCSRPPIADLYFDSAGESVFSTVVRRQYMEFDSLEEAEEGIKLALEAPPLDPSLTFEPGQVSIFDIRVSKKEKAAILDLFGSLDPKSMTREQIGEQRLKLVYDEYEPDESFPLSEKDGVWRGQFEWLMPFFQFVVDKGPSVAVVFDIYANLDLFGGMPSEAEIEETIAEIVEGNEAIGFEMMSADRDGALAELLGSPVFDAAQAFVEELACFVGVQSIGAHVRHSTLARGTENFFLWNDDVGLLFSEAGQRSANDSVLLGSN